MLTSEQRSAIDHLLHGVEDSQEVAEAVLEMQSAEELFAFALDYNWDDGVAIPTVIADHRLCDLATALLLFWRAEAIECFGPDAQKPDCQEAWFDLCKTITARILNGHYQPGPNSFDPELGRVVRHKLEKRGIPSLLLDPVSGVESEGVDPAEGDSP